MLQDLRSKATSKTTVVILFILALSMALCGIQNYFHGQANAPKVIATVNGEELTQAQQKLLMNRMKSEMHIKANQVLTEKQQTLLQQTARNQLIDDEILVQNAREWNLNLPQAFIHQAIQQMPIFLDSNKTFDPQKYARVLITLGYTEKQFQNDFKRSLIIAQLKESILKTSFQLPFEQNLNGATINQERSISVHKILTKGQTINPAKLTDKLIESTYKAHQVDLETPEQIQVATLELSADNLKSEVHVNDAEISAYFNEHQANFKHKTLADVAKQIKAVIANEKAEKLFLERSEELADLTYTNAESLEPAAKALGLKVHTSPKFDREGRVAITSAKAKAPAYLSNPNFLKAVLSEDVLQNGLNSEPVPLNETHVVVTRLTHYTPARLLSLKEARAQVKQIAQTTLQRNQAKLKAEKLEKELQHHPDQVKHLAWVPKAHLKLTPTSETLVQEAFLMKPASHPGELSLKVVPMENGAGYYLIKLDKAKAMRLSDPKKNKAINQALETQWAAALYLNFMDNLRETATIAFPKKS